MNIELRKKIEDVANIAAIEDTIKGRNRADYFISAMADHESGFREGFIEGVEYGYKKAIERMKEWWKQGSVWLDLMGVNDSNDLGDLINTFEADMNKLWEK